jgi:hypothetical protein
MQFPLRKRTPEQEMADLYLGVFTQNDNAQMVLGDILFDLKLWSPVVTEEDRILHNHALRMLDKMHLRDVLLLKEKGKIRFEVQYPREPYYPSGEPHDVPQG